ncbi:MAG TPA: YajQ family cyclic di-GMP-binding protein [Herpetosiphon sp.]|uniref:YajQ family cyclic di-GMP-binding protein n=1 Tax=Herpetosiphon sp. TaxID=71864 RepID=UPI000322B663|nr:YajQ family cyclic di-GMP-binding protein [Chloroflexota bacterium]HBW49346.1 YajQ family cyclic di-GMP-binding protein [Herpetosiphon sp.]
MGRLFVAEFSFDVVSDFDRQELINAVDQTKRDVGTRYDLKDTNTDITLGEKDITIVTSSELALNAVRDLLETKALRRNLSIKMFDFGEPEEIGGMKIRQVITLRKGIADDIAKKIQKLIKAEVPKAQARIQGDSLRVSSKSKDELQAVMSLLRERGDDFPLPLQFNNYR